MGLSASMARPMAPTMLSGSSSSRKKATSTTKVAPCIFCAGPNTSPGRLWAIMMWSRTSTANMGRYSWRSTIADQMAEGVGVRQDRSHPGGHIREGRFRQNQGVEPRIRTQGQSLAQSPVEIVLRAARGRHRPHLRGLQRQALAVERAAEIDGGALVAEPAELDHLPLEGAQRQGEVQARLAGRGVEHGAAVLGRV